MTAVLHTDPIASSVGDTGGSISHLAYAVLVQATSDLMRPTYTTHPADVRKAKLFLTSERHPWRADRHFWCALAGIDEAYVRSQAMAADADAAIEAARALRKRRSDNETERQRRRKAQKEGAA